MSGAYASLDIGSNSTRLLVVGADGNALAREMRVTALGSRAGAQTGALSKPAIERTVDCLRAYRFRLDALGVPIDDGRVRAVATSAARDASNRDVLFDRAAEVLGVRPVLLTGEEEGRLSFRGATGSLAARRAPSGEELDLLFDIGGGSTEIVVGVAGQDPIAAASLDAGCVRYLEQHLSSDDPPSPEALSAVITVMRDQLEDLSRTMPAARQASRLIGVAGTVTTMAAMDIGLHSYDRDRIHHYVLTRAAAEDVFRTVATEAREDRAANPGLSAERVDTIVAGAAIAVSVLRHFRADEVLVSEDDILDGVVADLRAG